jgi:bla regulator protein blaR1
MINYLINSTLCSGLLLLVYKLFLEREKMHRFNRFYLLGSLIISLAIPLISIELPENSSPILQQTFNSSAMQIVDIKAIGANFITQRSAENPVDYFRIVFVIYGLISLFFLAKFSINIFKIYQKISKSPFEKYNNSTLILMDEKLVAHSFLNYIFLNKTEYENGEIEPEILLHESTHVSQKHSYDILFIELIMSFLWINPFVYFYKKAIQLNHEFLADEAVIQSAFDMKSYQYLLLKKATNLQGVLLTSNFNFSTTKTRLIMMTKRTNPFILFAKKASIIPIFALMILLFNDCKKTEKEYGDKLEYSQNDVSDKELTDYQNSMVKYITVKGTIENIHITNLEIPKKEENRLIDLFKRMSKKQQESQDFIFYYYPEMEKEYPPQKLYEAFKDSSRYNILIDKVAVKNVELNNFKNTDFPSFFKFKLKEKPGKIISKKFYVTLISEKHFAQKNIKNNKMKMTFWSLNFKKGERMLVEKYLNKS